MGAIIANVKDIRYTIDTIEEIRRGNRFWKSFGGLIKAEQLIQT